ncbi:7041_t:CDS:2, partial [Dentiscutata erythropus]
MSERGTHEPYFGYNALVDYLQIYKNASYRSFLDLNRDVIISSTTSSSWNYLDNLWAGRFLREARKLGAILDEKNYWACLLEGDEIGEYDYNDPPPSRRSVVSSPYPPSSKRSCRWLRPYWDGIIKEYNKNFALKCFAYKIINIMNPEQIPENYQNQTICEICRKEISPQFPEPITILTCKHMFHQKCLKPHCPLCQDPEEHDHCDDSVGSSGSGYGNDAGNGIGTDPHPPGSSEVVDNNEQDDYFSF